MSRMPRAGDVSIFASRGRSWDPLTAHAFAAPG